MSPGLRALRLILVLAVFVAPGRAAGDVFPSAGGPRHHLSSATDAPASHGWAALPLSGGQAAIVHLPPRRDASRPSSVDAQDGTVRVATVVQSMPERLAAWGDQVFLIFPSESVGGGKRLRRVHALRTQLAPIGNNWISEPEGGRLPVLPPLAGEGSLVGFAGAPGGPMALIQHRADTSGRARYTLFHATGAGWVELAMPGEWWRPGHQGEGAGGELDRLSLLSGRDGPMLVAGGGARRGQWSLPWKQLESLSQAADSSPAEWRWTEYSEGREHGGVPEARLAYFYTGDQIVGAANRSPDGDVALSTLTPGAVHRLATVQVPVGDYAVVPLDACGRVAVVWQEQPSEMPGRPSLGGPVKVATSQPNTFIAEVSVFTGQVLYRGRAHVAGPVSQHELKLLAVALVGVMLIVVLAVFRPDAAGPELSLPEGFALAEPGRRMVAGAVDALVAGGIASVVAGRSVLDALRVDALLTEPGSLELVLLMLGIGFVHATLGDWLAGRSIGKAVTGCRVAAWGKSQPDEAGVLQPKLTRPTVWQAAMRNLVAWAVPPVAVWGMGGPDHRHKGDRVSGTVVVIPFEAEAAKP